MAGRRGRPRDAEARERILAAASELFVSQGYTATTMSGIAQAAGVAVQTLYAAFGSKVGVLSAVHDVALVGDDEPTPMLDRDWAQQVADAPTVAEGWALIMAHQPQTTVRVAPVYSAIQAAAADPEVGALLADLRAQRLRHSQEMADRLLALPEARGPEVRDRVADVLYATTSAESYALFVVERGWSAQAWRSWVHDTVLRELTDG